MAEDSNNRKRVVWRLLSATLLAVAISASGCGKTENAPGPRIAEATDLNRAGYVVASGVGTVALTVAQKNFPQTQVRNFSDCPDIYPALTAGKVDAVVFDRPALEYAALNNPDFTVLPDNLADGTVHVGVPLKNRALIEKVNAFIRQYRSDGTYQNMFNRWIRTKNPEMPEITEPENPDGVLIFGFGGENIPMSFPDRNKHPVGFDIEFLRRMALHLNMKCEFRRMDRDALLPACAAGEIDLIVADPDARREHNENILFSEAYLDSPIAVMIRREDFAGSAPMPPGSSARLNTPDTKIGVLSGTTMDQAVKKQFPAATAVYHNSFTDLPVALEAGKIDAFLLEEPQFRLISKIRPNLAVLPDKLSSDDYAFLFSLENRELCEAFSTQIRAMKADGTLKKLDQKWFSGNEAQYTLPMPLADPPKGVLRVATVPQLPPFSLMKDGKVVGYDIEVTLLAATKLGYAPEFVILEWSSLIEAVSSGKVDMGVGCITVTEERKQKACFSEPDYYGGLVVIVQKNVPKSDSPRWFTSIRKSLWESFDRTFLRENRWKLVLSGLEVTVCITILAAVLGTVLAFPICFMRRSRRYVPRMLGKLFISLMQGTPILVILMILYYVIFAQIDLNAVIVAVIGFGLNFAAYAGEMLRTGIDSVPRGQQEAALALGLSNIKTFYKVVLPQALRQILPVYRGEFINMLKTTSIVGYISIQDLTKMSDIIRSRTYEAFFPLIATAVVYFATAWILASGLTWLEHKLDPISRRKTAQKEKC